jgi:CBS domain-containing protein
MKIEKLMTRDVRTCRPEDNLVEPARIMWENDCGCVPVVDAEMHVIGMVTDRDVCMGAYTQGQPLAGIPVPRVMSRVVHWCRSSEDLEDAQTVMKTKQLRRIPVVNDAGRLVGVVSLSDVARAAASERTSRDKHLTLEAVGGTLAAICSPRRSAERATAAQPAPRAAVGATGALLTA